MDTTWCLGKQRDVFYAECSGCGRCLGLFPFDARFLQAKVLVLSTEALDLGSEASLRKSSS